MAKLLARKSRLLAIIAPKLLITVFSLGIYIAKSYG
jgi:hypothetical protein